MHSSIVCNPVVRSGIIILAMVGLIGGVTYAALQSQVKITSSNISTANAGLMISQNNSSFSSSVSGFNFGNIIPGGSAMPANGYPFQLKNSGGTPLTLKLGVSSIPTNADAVDLTKVSVIISSSTTTQTQTFSLQSLIDSYATGGTAITIPAVLFPDQVFPMAMQVSMAKDAFVGSSAIIGAIDYTITGTAVSS